MIEEPAEGEQGSKPEGEIGAAAARRRFELRAELVGSLGAAGVVLYVLLRFPYAIFYGRLGTSPEEVGLGYVQLLAQSSVLVAAVAAFGALICVYVLLGAGDALSIATTISSAGQLIDASRETIAKMSDADFHISSTKARQTWASNKWLLPAVDAHLKGITRLRDLDRRTDLTKDEKREQRALARMEWPFSNVAVGAVTLWRKGRRSLPWWFAGWSLAVMVGGLPWLAMHEAELVRNCQSVDTLPGFDYGGQPVTVLDSKTLAPQFTDRQLSLLGGDASRYVLFDCKRRSVVRTPTSTSVVVNAGS